MITYKLSKYTHITKNNNETILFNSCYGTDSIIKLNYQLDLTNLSPTTTKNFLLLQQTGHIVESSFNEDHLVEELYNRYQNKNYLSLTILPNETCNFRCVYCYESLKQGEMKETTIDAITLYVEKNIYKYDYLYVSWYGGEPLLSIDVITKLSQKLIDICRTHKKMYLASITTNGYCLDLETFKKLKKCNIFSYQITLDGYKQSHDKQRPLYNKKGTYDTILKNLALIKNNIKSNTFKIIIRTNCSKMNLKNFDLYVDDLLKYFSNDSRFLILLRPVMDWGGERIRQFEDELITASNINEFFNILLKRDNKGKLSYFTSLLEPYGSICYAGYKNHLTINCLGEIFKCTCDLNNNMGSRIGVISDDNKFVIDLLKTENWSTDIKYKRPECNNCDFSPICLYDYCPGKRMFKSSISLPCPFEKYFLDSLLILMSNKIDVLREED